MILMAVETVGNTGMGTANVASYQATAPKTSKPVETVVVEPVKMVQKPVAKPQVTDGAALSSGEEAELFTAGAAETLKLQNEITQEKMHKALDNINRKLSNTSCEYGYDNTTNRVTIKIIDKETDEVIRELPPEKTLQMIAKAWELAGLLVDERL